MQQDKQDTSEPDAYYGDDISELDLSFLDDDKK